MPTNIALFIQMLPKAFGIHLQFSISSFSSSSASPYNVSPHDKDHSQIFWWCPWLCYMLPINLCHITHLITIIVSYWASVKQPFTPPVIFLLALYLAFLPFFCLRDKCKEITWKMKTFGNDHKFCIVPWFMLIPLIFPLFPVDPFRALGLIHTICHSFTDKI